MSSKYSLPEMNKNRSLFFRLQNLSLTNLMAKEDRSHLDVESQEVLFRLKSNLSQLSELNQRLEFMMGEINQILKK